MIEVNNRPWYEFNLLKSFLKVCLKNLSLNGSRAINIIQNKICQRFTKLAQFYMGFNTQNDGILNYLSIQYKINVMNQNAVSNEKPMNGMVDIDMHHPSFAIYTR